MSSSGRKHPLIFGWYQRFDDKTSIGFIETVYDGCQGGKKVLFGGEKPIPLSTGREWDKETGLYYYRARYYDPMEGRFISKDPIGFNGGNVNLYGYVHDNPLNFTDPSGLSESSAVCIAKCWNPFNNGPAPQDLGNYEKGPGAKLSIYAAFLAKLYKIEACVKACDCIDKDCKCRVNDKLGELQEYQTLRTISLNFPT